MDVPVETVELKCQKCESYLSWGPVYLEHGGAAVCSECNECFSPERPATRNRAYEAAATLVRFPCRNRDRGCEETVCFEDFAHEARCIYNNWQQETAEQQEWKCAVCSADPTEKYYSNPSSDDWLCERCPPPTQACEYQDKGCTHQDIEDKCNKHELYFCQHGTTCYICEEAVSPGTLFTHYTSHHSDDFSTWRIENGMSSHCLVTCSTFTAVCWYMLHYSKLELCVYIPVMTERLCEFGCEIRITNPTTGLTRSYTTNITYHASEDWYFNITVSSSEIDISVNIFELKN